MELEITLVEFEIFIECIVGNKTLPESRPCGSPERKKNLKEKSARSVG